MAHNGNMTDFIHHASDYAGQIVLLLTLIVIGIIGYFIQRKKRSTPRRRR